MSTDKFHINDAAPGNDTHSNFLRRMGYGDLLNRPGRQEMTIDTASMYKSAAVGQGALLGTGAGALVGASLGADIAEAMDGSATTKLLSALAGAGLGGVGGYYVGREVLDRPGKDGLSASDRNTTLINQIGGAGIGGLAGYGISKYLIGSKNKAHHTLSALIGAGLGAGAGTLLANDMVRNENRTTAEALGRRMGYKGEDLNKFVQYYISASDKIQRESNRDGSWWDKLTAIGSFEDIYKDAPTAAAIAKARMEGKSEDEADRSWSTTAKLLSIPAGAGAYGGATGIIRRIARGSASKPNHRTAYGELLDFSRKTGTTDLDFIQKYLNSTSRAVHPEMAERFTRYFKNDPDLAPFIKKDTLSKADLFAIKRILLQKNLSKTQAADMLNLFIRYGHRADDRGWRAYKALTGKPLSKFNMKKNTRKLFDFLISRVVRQ